MSGPIIPLIVSQPLQNTGKGDIIEIPDCEEEPKVKVYFFGMTVCSARTDEHIGKMTGVVFADNPEQAESLAWEKYGNDRTCGL